MRFAYYLGSYEVIFSQRMPLTSQEITREADTFLLLDLISAKGHPEKSRIVTHNHQQCDEMFNLFLCFSAEAYTSFVCLSIF